MSVAIRGYGYFAAPCKKISPDQLPSLLSYLLSKSGFLVSSYVHDQVKCDRIDNETECTNRLLLIYI